MAKEKEYRGFVIHGREYWLSKDQIAEELGCPTEDVEKIWNDGKKRKNKAKAGKTSKSAKAAKPAKKGIEEDILAVMEKLSANGITEVTSRLISDKLGFKDPDKGRNKVRITMKKLEKAGKVVSEKKAVKEKGARKQYVYRLK